MASASFSCTFSGSFRRISSFSTGSGAISDSGAGISEDSGAISGVISEAVSGATSGAASGASSCATSGVDSGAAPVTSSEAFSVAFSESITGVASSFPKFPPFSVFPTFSSTTSLFSTLSLLVFISPPEPTPLKLAISSSNLATNSDFFPLTGKPLVFKNSFNSGILNLFKSPRPAIGWSELIVENL